MAKRRLIKKPVVPETEEPDRQMDPERDEWKGTLDEYMDLLEEEEEAQTKQWEKDHPKVINRERYQPREDWDPNMGSL